MSSSIEGMNQSVNPSALESAAKRDAMPAVAQPALMSLVFSAPEPTESLVLAIFVLPHPNDALGSMDPPLHVCGAVAR